LDKSYSPNKKIKLNSNDSQKPAFPSTISPLYERILESELAPKSSTIMSFGSPNKNKPINRLLFPSSSVTSEKFQSLPLSKNTLDILTGPRQEMRSISKTPFKVLDAPDLQVSILLKFII
jgi:cell division cycle 20-like protein 1 (cofactor of APC complex)